MPLTLTLLSAAFPAEKRGVALGAWSGIAGLAVAAGPLVGGAVVEGIAWQWIFWLNVPIGLVLLPVSRLLTESHGPDKALDLRGLALASVGMLGLVWGLVNGNEDGWGSPQIIGSLVTGVASLAAFVAWEARSPQPMLPLRSSVTARSQRRTAPRSRCTSACSARSSCCRSSSRPPRATHR